MKMRVRRSLGIELRRRIGIKDMHLKLCRAGWISFLKTWIFIASLLIVIQKMQLRINYWKSLDFGVRLILLRVILKMVFIRMNTTMACFSENGEPRLRFVIVEPLKQGLKRE